MEASRGSLLEQLLQQRSAADSIASHREAFENLMDHAEAGLEAKQLPAGGGPAADTLLARGKELRSLKKQAEEAEEKSALVQKLYQQALGEVGLTGGRSEGGGNQGAGG